MTKLRGGASALLDELARPAGDAAQALIHVRDFTKGHPEIAANNHPIRHGTVVGIHNGIIENDDELLARYGIERAEPQMTVDSEAIFALDGAAPARRAGALRDARRDGGGVARRTRRRDALPRARPTAAALARPDRRRRSTSRRPGVRSRSSRLR